MIIAIALVMLLISASSASAYIPKEHRTSEYMTDYDVFVVSSQFKSEHWAQYNLEILEDTYTNRPSGTQAALDALMAKMAFYKSLGKVR